MTIYQRNIDNKRLFLRIASFFLVSAILLACRAGSTDIAWVLGTLLLVCAVFPLATLEIGFKELTVTQYYFFGWFPRQVIFEKDQPIHMQAFEIKFDSALSGNEPGYFLPTEIEKYLLRQDRRRARIRLSRQERALIEQYFTIIHATTAPPPQP